MAEVMLVSPSNRAGYMWPPLSLAYIAAYLESHGHKTRIIDVKVPWINRSSQKIKEEILKQVLKESPRVVGISCFTTEVPEVLELSTSIKHELPETTVIAGGAHPTIRPQDLLLENGRVDCVVVGEGERTMLELVESSKPLKHISGLALKSGNGRIVMTPPRALVENLDELPFPAYDKLPMEFYTQPQKGLIRGVWISASTIFTSRGCPYRCTYCSSRNVFGRKVRYRSAKNVVDEIEMLANRYKIDGFYVLDDSFTVSKKHAIGICKELKTRGMDMMWGCETRVNLVDRELLEELKKAGCVQVDFGIESGSQKILDKLHKDSTIEQAKTAFLLCGKVGVRRFANFMINNPGETWADIEKTKALAKDLKADRYEVWVTTPYPGTELYEQFGSPEIPADEYPELTFGRELYSDAKIKNDIFKNVNLFDFRLKLQKEFDGYASKGDIGSFYLPLIVKSRHRFGYLKALATEFVYSIYSSFPPAARTIIQQSYRRVFPKPI